MHRTRGIFSIFYILASSVLHAQMYHKLSAAWSHFSPSLSRSRVAFVA